MTYLLATLWDALEGLLRSFEVKGRIDALRGTSEAPGSGMTLSEPISGTGYNKAWADDQIRATIVAFCESKVGQPYRYGIEHEFTESDPEGWDCSELTENAYNRAGLTYPDGCVNQLAQIGHRKVLEPKAGDPFFFGPNAQGIPHTGIYTGRGTAINALGGKVGHVIEQARYDVESHPRFLGWFRHEDLAYPLEDRA